MVAAIAIQNQRVGARAQTGPLAVLDGGGSRGIQAPWT